MSIPPKFFIPNSSFFIYLYPVHLSFGTFYKESYNISPHSTRKWPTESCRVGSITIPHLRERLQAAGYNPQCRIYMPVHVRMIVEAIGEP